MPQNKKLNINCNNDQKKKFFGNLLTIKEKKMEHFKIKRILFLLINFLN